MGTLRVLKKDKDGEKTLWSKNENAGDHWIEAHLDIKRKEINVYKVGKSSYSQLYPIIRTVRSHNKLYAKFSMYHWQIPLLNNRKSIVKRFYKSCLATAQC